MSTYAIGDVQGCYQSLRNLLKKINYNADRDYLWFTGDLINRGSESLKTLKFIKTLSDAGSALTVLGNHDLHLLAVAYSAVKTKKEDTIEDILNSKDKFNLTEWLRQQPLCHYDSTLNFFMVHAGLIPQWSISDALKYGNEVSMTLKNDSQYLDFLKNMYGNQPSRWSDNLADFERLRFITNVLTRIRYCTIDGELNLKDKGVLDSQKDETWPWFTIANRASQNDRIIFGHWAALYPNWGTVKSKTLFPVDSGCCWGNGLTALCLETQHYIFEPN